MSSNWVELLKESRGRSEYIIAINIDIRGFTQFSLSVESIDLGQYIKSIYLDILSKYFTEAIYSKPMGDGLFIIYNYEESTVKETVNMIVEKCVDLERDFNSLLKDNPMISFETPAKIGIGITRGTTCCIHNNEIRIDYSGKVLNHSARLVEKARPSGIVCDYISFFNILNEKISILFEEDKVCLRGISEKEPIQILIQKDKVKITDYDRRPIGEKKWDVVNKVYTVGFIRAIEDKWFRILLEKKPLIKDEILVKIFYSTYLDGEKVEGMREYKDYDITHSNIFLKERGPRYHVEIKFMDLIEDFDKRGIPDEEEIRVDITYPI